MMQPASPPAASLLARSLPSILLLAFIVAGVTWMLWVLAPVSPDPTYAQLRIVILIAGGVLTLGVGAMLVYVVRVPLLQVERVAQRLGGLLVRRWLILPFLLLLIEINLLALVSLGDIAPSITNPAKFLLVGWSCLFALLVLAANAAQMRGWLARTQPFWAALGIGITILLCLFALNWVNSRILRGSGIIDALRATFDYRRLIFVDDGAAPTSARAFWLEQNQMKARWTPYVYWTLEPYAGRYINVGPDGLRLTVPTVASDVAVPDVYFFGGSTAWGEGARDAYTIPSQLARRLHEQGQPARVTNYAQTGYVSTQDLILFQSQLLLGNIPDVAVFYQGFNDMLAAYQQGFAGLAYVEANRYNDFYAGRLLTEGEMVLRRPALVPPADPYRLVAHSGGDAAAIVERWLANVRMIQTLGRAYGVEVLVIWQPALYAKQTLTPPEARIHEQVESTTPGFAALYLEADRLLRQRSAAEDWSNMLLLTDLFADDEREVFYDLVHVMESGNVTIAETLYPAVAALLAP